MKHIIQLINFLFRPRGQIIIAMMLLSTTAIAQETPPPEEFPIGATIGYGDRTNLLLHQYYDSKGMNLIEQDTPESPVPYLENYNVHAVNMDSDEDYIYHYSSAYYSKWQAEQDTAIPYIGFKHRDSLGNLIGSPATWHDTLCWSTIGVISPRDSLLYGPHYHQEKWYRRWLYMPDIYDVKYIPRWRIALDTTNANLDTDENVCRLSVWVRHAPLIYNSGNGQWEWDSTVHNHNLKESEILKVSDFLANGQFKYFYLNNNPNQRWYQYPEAYQSPGKFFDRLQYPPEIPDRDTIWTDINGENGVEFRVEWLRSDTKCTMYVDYVEVYDDYGWKDFIENPDTVAFKIQSYAQNFSGWDKIKYWTGVDEPFTIDSYIPLRTVDSLLRDIGAPPLLVHVYPYWNVKINEDSMLARYYRTAKPDPLNIHFFPFNSWNVPSSYYDWEAFRTQLQISYILTKEKGFWYKCQNFGFWDDNSGSWLAYRQPEASEQKAEVMLALAHGVKALLLTQFESYPNCDPFTQQCYESFGLINLPPHYQIIEKDTLWYVFKDEIIPRLKGKLGKTLMDSLNYTGNYLQLQQIEN